MSGSKMLRAIMLVFLFVRMGCCGDAVSAQEKSVSDELRTFAVFLVENEERISFPSSLELTASNSEFWREQDTYEFFIVKAPEGTFDGYDYKIYRRAADGMFWVRKAGGFGFSNKVYGPMSFDDLKSFTKPKSKKGQTLREAHAEIVAFFEDYINRMDFSLFKLTPTNSDSYSKEDWYSLSIVNSQGESSDGDTYTIYQNKNSYDLVIQRVSGKSGLVTTYGPMTFDELKKAVVGKGG